MAEGCGGSPVISQTDKLSSVIASRIALAARDQIVEGLPESADARRGLLQLEAIAVANAEARARSANARRPEAKRPATAARYLEEEIQAQAVDVLHALERSGWLHGFWATPNGGIRNPIQAIALKRMGVSPGVPDLCVLLPGGRVGFVEVKTAAGKLSPAQVRFREIATATGCPYLLARSVSDVVHGVVAWLAQALESRR